MAKKKTKSPGTLAENRKARHDYNIEDTIEAGIALKGTEIKSIRRGSANLKIAMRKLNVARCSLIICTLHLMRKVTASIMTLYVLESYYFIRRKLLNLGNVRENWLFTYSIKTLFKTWSM